MFNHKLVTAQSSPPNPGDEFASSDDQLKAFIKAIVLREIDAILNVLTEPQLDMAVEVEALTSQIAKLKSDCSFLEAQNEIRESRSKERQLQQDDLQQKLDTSKRELAKAHKQISKLCGTIDDLQNQLVNGGADDYFRANVDNYSPPRT